MGNSENRCGPTRRTYLIGPHTDISDIALASATLSSTARTTAIGGNSTTPVIIAMGSDTKGPIPGVTFVLGHNRTIPHGDKTALCNSISTVSSLAIRPSSNTTIALTSDKGAVSKIAKTSNATDFAIHRSGAPKCGAPLAIALASGTAVATALSAVFAIPADPGITATCF